MPTADEVIARRLTIIETKLTEIQTLMEILIMSGTTSSNLDDRIQKITQAVSDEETTSGSASLLIQGLSAELTAAVAQAQAAGATTDQLAALDALVERLSKSQTALANAVAAVPPDQQPQPAPAPTPAPQPEPTPTPQPEPTPAPAPSPAPAPAPAPEPPVPAPQPTPEPQSQPTDADPNAQPEQAEGGEGVRGPNGETP